MLNKPAQLSSSGAVGKLRKKIGGARAGHTGTLDPFAEGLLLILIGGMTRCADLFSSLDKEYVGTFVFGKETSTLDPEGELVREAPVPDVHTVVNSLGLFQGSIVQVPPQYSAVHVQGKRAYELARKGMKAEIAPRQVFVSEITVESYELPEVVFRIRCSKGTYVRSLARDIGAACGSCCYVSRLIRTRVGPFSLQDAVDFEGFNPSRDILGPDEFFSRLSHVGKINTKPEARQLILHGVKPVPDFFVASPDDEGVYAVFDDQGTFLSLLHYAGGEFSYRFVADS